MQHTALAATTVRIALTVLPTNSEPAVTAAVGSEVSGRGTTADSRRASRGAASAFAESIRPAAVFVFSTSSLRALVHEPCCGLDGQPDFDRSSEHPLFEQAPPSRNENL
jgi:hypothetical protein